MTPDAGHICQNLYLDCEAIGAGTYAVATYHQQLMNRLVRGDGMHEFVIYLALIGEMWARWPRAIPAIHPAI